MTARRSRFSACCLVVAALLVRERTVAADASPALPDLPPERRAFQVVAQEERSVDAAAARAQGLTIVDLSDAWAPTVLDGASYRSVFTALAADRGDADGQPLAAGERNYLELYGIPPALSVLRRRFLVDKAALRPRARLLVGDLRTETRTEDVDAARAVGDRRRSLTHEQK